MPPQWIARLCDFLEVCVVTECSQKMSKVQCYRPPSYHLFVRKPPCWTHLPSDLVLSNTAALVQSCWAYRGDNGVPWRSVAKLPAASFLSATLQSKFENIGLIETQCSILIPGSPWTYHGNCQGETNSNYHDARVQHLHSRMLRASWSCKHRAWHTWAIWVFHFDCPCFAHSLTNNHRFWMHFPSFFLSPFGYMIYHRVRLLQVAWTTPFALSCT